MIKNTLHSSEVCFNQRVSESEEDFQHGKLAGKMLNEPSKSKEELGNISGFDLNCPPQSVWHSEFRSAKAQTLENLKSTNSKLKKKT